MPKLWDAVAGFAVTFGTLFKKPITESGMSKSFGFSANSAGSAPAATRCSARSPTTSPAPTSQRLDGWNHARRRKATFGVFIATIIGQTSRFSPWREMIQPPTRPPTVKAAMPASNSRIASTIWSVARRRTSLVNSASFLMYSIFLPFLMP